MITNSSTPFNYIPAQLFAQQYYLLRKKEQRIYTDAELLCLPFVQAQHPHFKEWQIRKRSGRRLVKYLQQKNTPLKILEVGCGNGWLSAQLAAIENTEVTGIDINDEELEQAQRVFGTKQNLQFIFGDLREDVLQDNIFDIIIFAASLQYFPSLKEIVNRAVKQLTLQGEIHIVDTHFYTAGEAEAAKQRTEKYFASVGFETMANFYFHHSMNELERFNHKFLYNPSAFLSRFNKNKNPFHHVIIKNSRP